MKTLIVAMTLLATGCGPSCVKGHDEMVTVPGHTRTTYTYIQIGKHSVSVPHETWVPEHQAPRFVCDQYEKRK